MDLAGNIVGFMNEPIPSFFFDVLFLDDNFDPSNPLASKSALASLALQALDPIAAAFSEVSGLEMAFSTETVNEAGWSLPRDSFDKMTSSELELKRYLRPRHIGVMGFSLDPVSSWCQKTFESAKTWAKAITKKDILIFIYHPMVKNPLPIGPSALFPVAGFLVKEAFPVKWTVSPLNSTDDSQAITETISFKYTELTRLAIPG